MNFPVSAPTIKSRVGQAIGNGRSGGVTFGMAANGFCSEFGHGEAPDLRGSARKMIADEIGSETDGFKELAAVVTGEHADSHLRHNFKKSLVESVAIGGEDFRGIEIGKRTVCVPASGEFPDKVRANGRGTEGDETSKVVDVTRIGGIGDEGNTHPHSCTNQAVVDGGDGEEHGECGMVGIGSTIGEAENGDPFLNGGGGFFADFAQAFLEGTGTARDGEEDRKSARAEMRFFAGENVRKFCRSQNRGG